MTVIETASLGYRPAGCQRPGGALPVAVAEDATSALGLLRLMQHEAGRCRIFCNLRGPGCCIFCNRRVPMLHPSQHPATKEPGNATKEPGKSRLESGDSTIEPEPSRTNPASFKFLKRKDDFVAGGGVSRDERTGGAVVPDEPGRRLLSGPAYGRNSFRKGAPRTARPGENPGRPGRFAPASHDRAAIPSRPLVRCIFLEARNDACGTAPQECEHEPDPMLSPKRTAPVEGSRPKAPAIAASMERGGLPTKLPDALASSQGAGPRALVAATVRRRATMASRPAVRLAERCRSRSHSRRMTRLMMAKASAEGRRRSAIQPPDRSDPIFVIMLLIR